MLHGCFFVTLRRKIKTLYIDMKKLLLISMLALLVALQAVTKPLGQLVTGSCVNAVLAVATLFVGLGGGLTVALVSPVCAFLLGIAPNFVTVLPIMLGNAVYALLLHFISGKAYVKGEVDKVFDSSKDGYHIFTGVLYGAPKDQYAKNLVAKTYTKVTIGSDEFVIYGEEMVANFFDIAKALKAQCNLSPEAQAIVDNIINEATGPDIGFDWGEL